MAQTSEFGLGRSILILGVVIGCFAILWPKVFYPMMHSAFSTSPKPFADEQGEQTAMAPHCNPVCCDVIYENKIDLKFFAELCKSVIEREMATDGGIRKHRREKYPPPGMMERCRKKILELCDIDITEALLKTKRSIYFSKLKKGKADGGGEANTIPTTTTTSTSKPKISNLTECLEKHFQYKTSLPRRVGKEQSAKLPSHIRQERPSHLGRTTPHPALKEKGNPFPSSSSSSSSSYQDRPIVMPGKPGPMSAMRPSGGHTKTTATKGGGAMSLLMPVYTVGIVVFFLYTISKIVMRKPVEEDAPKVVDFHVDPDYHRYITRHEYGNGQPMSYKDYMKQKSDNEALSRATSLLDDTGRKQVFTAIEGIIAEMDEYRERLMAEQTLKKLNNEEEEEKKEPKDVPELADGIEEAIDEDIDVAEAATPPAPNESEAKTSLDKLEDELARITALSSDDTKIAVMGMETQVEFQEKSEEPIADEISNIVLETSVPSDSQLLVAESQCLTHTMEAVDGWPDLEDQPVVVTGKMTISLLSKDATEKTPKRTKSPKPQVNSLDRNLQQREIEKLANALVDDILRQQVPKAPDVQSMPPEVDSFEVINQVTESRRSKSPFGRSINHTVCKQASRDSLNSQGSSFEYVSACQDDMPASAISPCTPILEERPLSSLSSTSSELIVLLTADNANGLDPTKDPAERSSSFECVSAGSISPLSPETEHSFEKVPLTTNNGHQRPRHSQSEDMHHRHPTVSDSRTVSASGVDNDDELEESDSAEATPEFDDVIQRVETKSTEQDGHDN